MAVTELEAIGAERHERLRHWPSSVLRLVRKKPLGALGAVTILVLIILAVFAEQLAPYDPLRQHYAYIMVGPGAENPGKPRFILGTDTLGRDTLSRIIFGARISLTISIAAVLVGKLLGTTLGVVSGYFMGKLDLFLQRVMDSMQAVPAILLAIILVAVFGQSIMVLILAIGITQIASTNRVVRGSTMSVKENTYIEAARTTGCDEARILFRHVLPNIFAPIIVLASTSLGSAILAESSLAFLGLGAAPPTPSWGNMVSESREFISYDPWLLVPPSIALSLAILGVNLFGDALRDILDPRLRTG